VNISKYFVAISVCVVSAAIVGCASVAPQYQETSATVVSSRSVQSVARDGAGEQQSIATQTVLESREPSAAERKPRPNGVTGVWRGEARANCNVVMMADVTRCGAVNVITFTLLQNKANVSGYYRCAYGNMNCYNMNETGRIATGNMSKRLLRMRVMMPDGSDCVFNGWPMGDAMRGSYTCLQGGGLLEQGQWSAMRSY
jgi:hypothetical protein